MMTNLSGKTVLITGASRGLGAMIARTIAPQNNTIIGIARSAVNLEKVKQEVEAHNSHFIPLVCDFKNIDNLRNIQSKLSQYNIDVLINNAGLQTYQAFQNFTIDEIQAMFSVNLLSAMEITRLLLPSMLERNQGHIVNIASLTAKKGNPFDSVYSATKAGLLMWSDALRQELVDTNLKISIICPGYITEEGMFVKSGIPAPKFAGVTDLHTVAKKVVKAIEKNKIEVIINQDLVAENFFRFLVSLSQFSPTIGDLVYRLLGIVTLNEQRVKYSNNQPN